MKYKHYSPETPLTIVKDLNKKIANDDKWSKVAFVFPESQRSLIPENSILYLYVKIREILNQQAIIYMKFYMNLTIMKK